MMKIKRAIIITVLLLPLALTFSIASAGDTDWDKQFSQPQYLIHVNDTVPGLWLLYTTPPQNGAVVIPGMSGSDHKSADYSSGPLTTPRQVCAAAQARGVENQIFTPYVIGSTGATALIGGTVTTASNIDGTTISVNVVPGTFTVGTSTLKGDCDGDGKLDEREVLAALQMSVGKRPLRYVMTRIKMER
jgi:hypothetical protein